MKLFIDANLSPKVAVRIADAFPNSLHMFSTEMEPDAPDIDIWNYAKKHGLPLILTYDEDFRNLAERLGPPPKVILLRLYDQKTATVVKLILDSKENIMSFLDDDETEVLELRVS
jgi:predicted nuclease of predicted toxin-antitoxin system